MSTIATSERSRSRFDNRRGPRRGATRTSRPDRAQGSVDTLERVVLATMDRLSASGTADCPVCSAPRLRPAGCDDCGSRLS